MQSCSASPMQYAVCNAVWRPMAKFLDRNSVSMNGMEDGMEDFVCLDGGSSCRGGSLVIRLTTL